MRLATLALVAATSFTGADAAVAQDTFPTGLEVGGLPAINYDSDEGFGYGAFARAYQYGRSGLTPYEWTVQPTLFFTTEGRRDIAVFFDAPYVLPSGWCLTLFAGTQKHIATPYYGMGNDTPYDEMLEDDEGPNPYYYRFGRIREGGTFMLQRPLGHPSVRLLFGGGLQRVTIDPVPKETGTTLYAEEFGGGQEKYWANFVRGGVIWDSRDRESGPTRGTWTELLVQWADEGLGADVSFTRWTFADRRYFTLTEGLVFAHRWLVQDASAGAPVFELFSIQTSFEQQEGLGGSNSVRGVLKNRFVGRGLLVWNAELRWRVADFRFLGRDAHVALTGFVDQGRVWAGGVRASELFTDLHRGYGAGARLGLGENFVIAWDVATSKETGLPFYVGLGYLF